MRLSSAKRPAVAAVDGRNGVELPHSGADGFGVKIDLHTPVEPHRYRVGVGAGFGPVYAGAGLPTATEGCEYQEASHECR